jgi:hypothetical protein
VGGNRKFGKAGVGGAGPWSGGRGSEPGILSLWERGPGSAPQSVLAPGDLEVCDGFGGHGRFFWPVIEGLDLEFILQKRPVGDF